jgi:hypothetical protein
VGLNVAAGVSVKVGSGVSVSTGVAVLVRTGDAVMVGRAVAVAAGIVGISVVPITCGSVVQDVNRKIPSKNKILIDG